MLDEPSPSDPQAPQNHTRFQEWANECQLIGSAGGTPPPFTVWLKDKDKQESAPVVRIRGDNPPIEYIEEAGRLDLQSRILILLLVSVLGAEGVIVIVYPTIPDAIRWPGIIMNICVLLPVLLHLNKIKKQRERYKALVELHPYTHEFDIPLAATTQSMKITVRFDIPEDLRRLTEKLNLEVRTILQKYASTKTGPLSNTEIEDHLQTALGPFQDERAIPVLRVQVSLVTMKAPPNPAGGGIYV
jgi:hypothetical protein